MKNSKLKTRTLNFRRSLNGTRTCKICRGNPLLCDFIRDGNIPVKKRR